MTHLFYECQITKVFWNKVKMSWEGLENVLLNLTEKDIILGILGGTSQTDHEDLLNILILLGKKHIWKCRKNGESPSILQYKYLIKKQYCTEKYIAVKRNEFTAFHKKWGIYEHGKISDNC